MRPKPMVELGGKPILWHIMKIYSHYGLNDFIVCLGYKGYVIKEYFANYFLHMSDITINLRSNDLKVHQNMSEPWSVTLVDTGDTTETGGRLGRRAHAHRRDVLPDLRRRPERREHHEARRVPPGAGAGGHADRRTAAGPVRRHRLRGRDRSRRSRRSRPGDGSWINGGFSVLEPRVLDLIEGDHTIWERGPLERLARDGELSAYKHEGFWQPMDTFRDRTLLESLWASGKAPWKTW